MVTSFEPPSREGPGAPGAGRTGAGAPREAEERGAPAGVPEPFAARLHFIPRSIRHLQRAIVRVFRRYFERAPGWVLLTTTGRVSGLPREVLLPCERTGEALIVISTYGERSNWIRNLRRDPIVRVTCGGWVLDARAEVIEDPGAKRSIVSAHPFFPGAPFLVVNFLHRTLLRPVWVPFLRWWVRGRPIVVIRPDAPLLRPANGRAAGRRSLP